MTELGKLIHAVDNIKHDIKHLGYLRKEATEQDLPVLISSCEKYIQEQEAKDLNETR